MPDGCSDVHRCGPRVVGDVVCRARPVTTLQRATDVIPARVVLPQRRALGVEDNVPRTIGHVYTQLDSRLLDCVHLRVEAARIEILECRPQPGYVDRPVLQVQFYQRGQQVRRLDQAVFRGLPVAGSRSFAMR